MLPLNPLSQASVGKIQLWAELERKTNELRLQVSEIDLFLLYAPSAGAGNGKVYGGCAGHNERGQWSVILAYGPIGAAKVNQKSIAICAGARTAQNILRRKWAEKSGHYRADWPGDRGGLSVERCRCGTAYAAGGHCHVCRPGAAKASAAADTRTLAVALTRSRSAQLPPPPATTPPATPPPGDNQRDVLDDYGTNNVRW